MSQRDIIKILTDGVYTRSEIDGLLDEGHTLQSLYQSAKEDGLLDQLAF